MKVADHVLLRHAPPEALHEQPGDPRRNTTDADPGALANAVDGARRDVAYACVLDVQVDEQVVWEPVPAVQAGEVEPRQRIARDRGVSRLRVGNVPVAGRDLREERKRGVPEVAR